VEGDDGARYAGDRAARQVGGGVADPPVVVGQRRAVVGDDAEVVGGAARRRRPVVRRPTNDAVHQRHPLTHRPVLDDVVVGRRPAHLPVLRRRRGRHVVDERLGAGAGGGGGARPVPPARLPAQQEAVAVRVDGQVVRLRRSPQTVERLERVACATTLTTAHSTDGCIGLPSTVGLSAFKRRKSVTSLTVDGICCIRLFT